MHIQGISLFAIAFLVGADELLLGPILTPIGNDFSVRPESVTLFVTAYSLGNAVCAFFFGALSDRYGRMQVLIPASIVFAGASVATALTECFSCALFFRVVTGAASAGMLPIAFAIAADTGTSRAIRSVAFVQAGLTLGMVTSPSLGALLTELFSWRIAFASLGIAALPFALMAMLIRTAPVPAKSISQPVRRARLLVPGSVGALIAMGFGLGGGTAIFTLIGERLRDIAGLGTGTIGGVYALLGVVSVIGNVAMPRISARFGDGRHIMRCALVVCLTMNAVVFVTPAGWPLAFALPLWALAAGIGSPALMNYIAELATARRGALMALGMTAMHGGLAVTSGLAGMTYAMGSEWTAALGTLLFALAILALRPAKGPAESETGHRAVDP